MTKLRLTLCLVYTAVFVGSMAVAYFFPDEFATRVFTVGTVVIAVSEILYSRYGKAVERMAKAEEARERVNITPAYGPWDSTANLLGVVIYNETSNPVHVK